MDEMDRQRLIQLLLDARNARYPDVPIQRPQTRNVPERRRVQQLGMIPRPPPPPAPSILAILRQKLKRSWGRSKPNDRYMLWRDVPDVHTDVDRLQGLGNDFPHTNLLPTDTPESDRVVIIAGNEKSPHGMRSFTVARPQLDHIGTHWAKALKRNTRRTLWRKPKWTKHVILADDDADAVSIILSIVHLRTDMLPRTLSLKEFIHLAQLSERYQLNYLLAPNVERWFAPHREFLLQPGRERWLYVTWQFGLEEDYLRLSRHLLMNCTTDEQSRLIAPGTNRVLKVYPEGRHSPEIQTITLARLSIIAKLLATTYNTVDRLLGLDSCRLRALPEEERVFCSGRSSLALHRFLTRNQILPRIAHCGSVHLSVTQLQQLLVTADLYENVPEPDGSIARVSCRGDPKRIRVTPGTTATISLAREIPQIVMSGDHEEACDVGLRLREAVEETMRTLSRGDGVGSGLRDTPRFLAQLRRNAGTSSLRSGPCVFALLASADYGSSSVQRSWTLRKWWSRSHKRIFVVFEGLLMSILLAPSLR
ncbi:hypothetical protein CC86DRAFT_178506 [Ophiobolus disseminans]|uniref:BTB domain-containing protein n=1 Tax=Ophiobolus disseminans TaxID=1469910 RepID=A0A6A7AB92_9PLEO|nr:hypothetical protein CC86DRAFT_178506 [Ophiobolus disseminans]